MPERWVEHTVTADEAGRTVQEILTGPLGVSRRMIQRLTRGRGIRHNRRPAALGKKVRAGDVVAARLGREEEAGIEPVPMQLEVVHEDTEVLVVNKPAFLLVHPTSPEHTRTLSHGIVHYYLAQGFRAKVRPVHRLDRDTSGLLLVAKSAWAHHQLDLQLREGAVERRYLALVSGVPQHDEGVIDAPIGKHREHPHLRAVRPQAGERAVTLWRVVERYAHAALLDVVLETGRTHQIRVHLAHAGHPVLGDRPYGGRGLSLIRRQALHAWRLSFRHPATGERLELEAPLPEDLAGVRERLREGVEP